MTSGTGKSSANGNPTLPTTFVNPRKRKFNLNPQNVSDEFHLKDPLLHRLSSAAAITNSFLQSNDLFLPPSQSLHLESFLSSISPSPSTSTWFNRFLSSAVDDEDPRWNLYFRMSKSNFFNLLTIFDSPSLSSSSLAATIFRLAHNASYNSLVTRFGFDSIPDASRAFFTVCKLINEKLGQIDDPKPDYSPRLLPNCCGVLGFGRFEVDGNLIGSKCSLIVQALVDSNGRFVDISAGWPSTVKPDAIFRQSKLFSTAEDKESKSFFNGAPYKLENGISVPCYILGDSYLPLLPWNLTPYNEEEEEEEEGDSLKSFRGDFNNVIHTALQRVDVAFDKVRARWAILDTKWKQETIEFLPFVITTCCLLHNFLVNSDDDDDDDDEGYMNGVACDNVDEMRKYEEDEETRRIRDAIAENLTRVSSD